MLLLFSALAGLTSEIKFRWKKNWYNSDLGYSLVFVFCIGALTIKSIPHLSSRLLCFKLSWSITNVNIRNHFFIVLLGEVRELPYLIRSSFSFSRLALDILILTFIGGIFARSITLELNLDCTFDI